MSRSWVEVVVHVPAEHADAVANFLIEEGAPGAVLDENGLRAAVSGHFSQPPRIDAIENYCRDIGCLDPIVETRQVDEENWAENWKEHFIPLLIGNRLYVCPPWSRESPPDRVAVVIKPGMAFGTGHHASTIGCLVLLESVVSDGPIECAMDVGTGSGILAISLAKLGVRNVVAADIDPVACEVAHENVIANCVGDSIQLTSSWEDHRGPFDVLVANLFANLLIERHVELLQRVRPGGLLICSGFILDDADRVARAFESAGSTCELRWQSDQWVALRFRRSKSL